MLPMDIVLLGSTFTDFPLADVGSGAFQLQHDWFIKQDLQLFTAAGGGGTHLDEGTDYTLGEEDVGLSERVSDAVGAGRNVYHTITIVNVAYQTGALYASGKFVADSRTGGDICRVGRVVTNANDVLGAKDAFRTIAFSTGGSTRNATIPPSAWYQDAEFDIQKIDSGAGEIALICSGSDVFYYPDGSSTTLFVGRQWQGVRLRGVSGGYLVVGGCVQPVAGEPSLGTPHPTTGQHSGYLVGSVSPGAGTWYTVTFTVPAGTRAVIISECMNTAATDSLRWRPYNDGAAYTQSVHRLLLQSYGGDVDAGQNMVSVDSLGRVDFAVGVASTTFSIGHPQFYVI